MTCLSALVLPLCATFKKLNTQTLHKHTTTQKETHIPTWSQSRPAQCKIELYQLPVNKTGNKKKEILHNFSLGLISFPLAFLCLSENLFSVQCFVETLSPPF